MSELVAYCEICDRAWLAPAAASHPRCEDCRAETAHLLPFDVARLRPAEFASIDDAIYDARLDPRDATAIAERLCRLLLADAALGSVAERGLRLLPTLEAAAPLIKTRGGIACLMMAILARATFKPPLRQSGKYAVARTRGRNQRQREKLHPT